MILNFCQELEHHYELLIQEKSDAVANGAATDFSDYRSRCGEIRGLTRALRDVAEIRRQIMDGEDDDV